MTDELKQKIKIWEKTKSLSLAWLILSQLNEDIKEEGE